jgi:hypothetical protein
VFPEDVADAEPGEAGATMVAEEWIVEERLVATLGQQRTKNFGRLRPQWANAFFASLAKEANVRRRLEPHIKDAKSDDFLNTAL